MTEPLRVLQVMTSLDRGGMETMTMNFYRNIDRSRVQFDFLLHRDGEGDYEAEACSLGARVFRVPRQNPLSRSYWRALDHFFVCHPYKIVHAQLDCMSALPLAVARRHGAVVRIAHSHNSRQDRDYKYPLKLVCKRFIRREATDLFACGVEAGRWMFGTDDFTVVRNAIDVDAYAFDENRRERVREAHGIAPSAPVVGHVGRFSPVKNHAFILDVFVETLKLRPDAVLVLVGDGELRAETERRAEVLGISSNVHFLGVRSDVADLMQAMDVFFMPSRYEGLPLVLVEAQASGLPCVISTSIPVDCDLRGSSITRLSLDAPVVEWAAMVAGSSGEAIRSNGAEIVRRAGFDARETAGWLGSFYLDRAGVSRWLGKRLLA